MSEKANYTHDDEARFYDEGFMTPDEQAERQRGLEETAQYLKSRPSQDAQGRTHHPETGYCIKPEKYFDVKRDQAYNHTLADTAYDSDKVSISELSDTLAFFEERTETMPVKGKVGREAYAMTIETAAEVRDALQNKLSDLSFVRLTKLLAQAEIDKNETLAGNIAEVIEDKVDTIKSERDPEHNEMRMENLNARLDDIYEKEVDKLWAARKSQKAKVTTPEPESREESQPIGATPVQPEDENRVITADELDAVPESSETGLQSEPELVAFDLDEHSGRKRLVERYSAEKHRDLTIDPSIFITPGKRRRTLLRTRDFAWLYLRGDKLFNLTEGNLVAREEKPGEFPSFKMARAWEVIPDQLVTRPVQEVLNHKDIVEADNPQLRGVSSSEKDLFVEAERHALDILKNRNAHDDLQVVAEDMSAPASTETVDASGANQQARRERNARNIWNVMKNKVINFSPREFYGDKEKGTKRAKATLLGAVVTLFATGGVVASELFSPHQIVRTTPQGRPHQPEHSASGDSGLNITMTRSSKKPHHHKKAQPVIRGGHKPGGSEMSGGTTTHTRTSHDGLNVTMIRSSQPVPAPKNSK